jgi:hypothetical protein
MRITRMEFFGSVGVLPIVLTLASIIIYGRHLRTHTTHILANFFASLLIGCFVSALLFSNLAIARPLCVFAAQCLSSVVFLALVKLACRYAKVPRTLFVKSDRRKDQLFTIGILSFVGVAAIDLFPADLDAKCTTFRCRGFDFLFGEGGSFSYYYITSLLGTILLFNVLAVAFNISAKGISDREGLR